MDDTGVRQPADQAYRAQRSAFEIAASKLRPPPARPGAVGRPSLIERLRRDDSGPIVSVVAPAGYGKTTLLAQWAEDNGQAFAWLSADEKDNDPKILLTYMTRVAIHRGDGRAAPAWPARRR